MFDYGKILYVTDRCVITVAVLIFWNGFFPIKFPSLIMTLAANEGVNISCSVILGKAFCVQKYNLDIYYAFSK